MKASHPNTTRAVLKPAFVSTVLTMATPPLNFFEINERRFPELSCTASRRALNPLFYVPVIRQADALCSIENETASNAPKDLLLD